jgi:hypothetical protein
MREMAERLNGDAPAVDATRTGGDGSDFAPSPEPDPMAGRRRAPQLASEGGTLDGRILSALSLKPGGPVDIANRVEESPQLVKERLTMLLAEGEVERGRGNVFRRVH